MRRRKNVEIHIKQPVSVNSDLIVTPADSEGSLTGLYSDKTRKLVLEGGSIVRSLEITVSASKSDDNQLLHQLISEVRRDHSKDYTPTK